MKRKIIHIATVSPGRSQQHSYNPSVVALADDGTVWAAAFNPGSRVFDPWERLPDVPENDAEAAEILANHHKVLEELRSPSSRDGHNRRFIRRNCHTPFAYGLHPNPEALALNGTPEDRAMYVRKFWWRVAGVVVVAGVIHLALTLL